MTWNRRFIGIVAGALMIGAIVGGGAGCLGDSESGESGSGAEASEHDAGPESGESGEAAGEHDGSSESGEGEEESNTQLTPSETHDEVRAGARLILSYDSTTNAFTGSVENTTDATLTRVRVEVHLSNGIELGPTTPVDMAPDQVIDVNLPAGSQPFESWSAHPEVG